MTNNIYHNKNDHCSYCGGLFLTNNFPQKCIICSNITYLNPLPVSVIIIPVLERGKSITESGVLIVRRAIEPKLGEWALPGGFIELNESWQEGAIREAKEEIGLELSPEDISIWDIKRADNGNILIFGLYKDILCFNDIKFIPNREVSDINISYGLEDIAFPTHREVLKNYFKN